VDYTSAQRGLQDRFDSRRIADRINALLVDDQIDEGSAHFITTRDMFFLSTVDPDGQPTCSYKGGAPGFVRVLDPHTLAFPSYDGNGMFLSLGNVAATGKVGMLFLDFQRPSRLRLHGTATVDADDPMLGDWPGAKLVVRVAVTAVFPNCPRYLHRMEPVERSKFVPVAGVEPPTPDWNARRGPTTRFLRGDPAAR
jgi:predicted pyridoxine 5'-phosphate oxidase superfamily flavin-nucleotide-binding protein